MFSNKKKSESQCVRDKNVERMRRFTEPLIDEQFILVGVKKP